MDKDCPDKESADAPVVVLVDIKFGKKNGNPKHNRFDSCTVQFQRYSKVDKVVPKIITHSK